MYQTGLTIKDALSSVSNNLYVLPAIQREFVWDDEQICRLFDSLMQGYPFIDVKQLHHVDHVYPKGLLTRGKLKRAGLDEETIDECFDARNSLPNLQLLEGLLNVTKSDTPPDDWLKSSFPDKQARRAYRERHDLGKVPKDVEAFPAFLEARSERIREKLVSLLGGAKSGEGEN